MIWLTTWQEHDLLIVRSRLRRHEDSDAKTTVLTMLWHASWMRWLTGSNNKKEMSNSALALLLLQEAYCTTRIIRWFAVGGEAATRTEVL